MIRLWLARGTSIPIREQLTSQIILGILSQRLVAGERLPSVRELARRLGLHANTVSAAYRDLDRRGWVGHRRGGGVFVRQLRMPAPANDIVSWARTSLRQGLEQGYSLAGLQAAFAALREGDSEDLLVVDPDGALAQVLAAEIGDALHRQVPHAALSEAHRLVTSTTTVLANAVHALSITATLSPASFQAVPLRSMQDVLIGLKRPPLPVLIGVVSRSASILQWATTLLSALGFPENSILQRNPEDKQWQNGLDICHMVGADVVAAKDIPPSIRTLTFHIVAQSFLDELRAGVTA